MKYVCLAACMIGLGRLLLIVLLLMGIAIAQNHRLDAPSFATSRSTPPQHAKPGAHPRAALPNR